MMDETELLAKGWRRCAIGQTKTQWCAQADEQRQQDEALLRQALEALETVVEHFDPYMGDNECRPMENARYTIAALRERLRRDAEAEARLTVAQQPAEQHSDDAAVDRFAAAMKAKLKKKRQEGREGWQFMASEQLSALLHEHVRKGDPVDVANLAMMLHQNGQVIEPPAAVVTDEVKEPALWRCTVCGRVGTVGRCCGGETREPVNHAVLSEENSSD